MQYLQCMGHFVFLWRKKLIIMSGISGESRKQNKQIYFQKSQLNMWRSKKKKKKKKNPRGIFKLSECTFR